MCIRLYPDIIVASKLMHSFEMGLNLYKNYSLAIDNIYISSGSCARLQYSCKNIGIENVFISDDCSDKSWEKEDFEKFFKTNSLYFIDCEDGYYKLKSNIFKKRIKKERYFILNHVKNIIVQNILSNSYPDFIIDILI